jgi:polyisoprenyl-teichoic acid--peptidoglycan teichoic acid transferase
LLAFLKNIRIVKRPTTVQFILIGLVLAAAVGAFFFARGFVACWRLTALAGMPPVSCSGPATTLPVTNAQGTPVQIGAAIPTANAPQVALPPPWDGASRVTIMIIGLDFGDWSADRAGPSRSDTMLLLTIDPVSKTAGMLSVPRDMWVNIPGFGYS